MTALRRSACLFPCLLLCAAALLAARPAQAQSISDRVTNPVVSGTPKYKSGGPTPPPALPGTTLNRDRQAPAEKSDQDLQPNDALFDAITRGDIASARDALNRGADINAHDVLGLTPLDLSIDLSRNDITFLLLSLRASQPSSRPPAPPAAVAKGGARPAPAPKAAILTQTVTRKAPRAVAEAAPERPAVGDPGRPNPQFGFLGFGG
jgi:hypothetical protein